MKETTIKVSQETRDEYRKWCKKHDETYDSGLLTLLDEYPLAGDSMAHVDHQGASRGPDGLDEIDRKILRHTDRLVSMTPKSVIPKLSDVTLNEVRWRCDTMRQNGYLTYFSRESEQNQKQLYTITPKGQIELQNPN